MSDAERASVRRLILEVWGGGNLSLLDELVAPDVRVHVASHGEDVVGVEHQRQLIATYQALFGSVEFQIDDQLQDGDKVVTRWTARVASEPGPGTMGISIHRFADGRITDAWDTWDMLSALERGGDDDLLERMGIQL